MKIYNPSIISVAFVLITTAYMTCYADVEDVIRAQKEVKQKAYAERDQEREVLRGTEDAIQLGEVEYMTNCMLCHGKSGKGDGIFSPQLAHKPTDLTQIKKNHNGIFPFIKIYEIIDGRIGAGVHGSRTMPIWGGRYSAESWFDVSTKHAETVARGKIFELILYINTIQEK